nr:immunoglobulin heavy chain junction region [Macaca mulatta]
CTRQQSNFDCW